MPFTVFANLYRHTESAVTAFNGLTLGRAKFARKQNNMRSSFSPWDVAVYHSVLQLYMPLYFFFFPVPLCESKTNAYPAYCPCLQVLLRMLASHREHSQHDPVALALEYPNYKVAIVTLNSFLFLSFHFQCNNLHFYGLLYGGDTQEIITFK